VRQDRDPALAERRLEAHGKQHQGEAAEGRAGEGRGAGDAHVSVAFAVGEAYDSSERKPRAPLFEFGRQAFTPPR
jgi:hypothetical protein